MTSRDALALIEPAVPLTMRTWADLGAGDGTFTRALAERLGPEARIFAIDRDASAIGKLARWASKNAPNVATLVADIEGPLELPWPDGGPLDGMLFANSLHFVADGEAALARLVACLRPG